MPPIAPIRIVFYLASGGAGTVATWEDKVHPQPFTIDWDELCDNLSQHTFTPCGVNCVGHDCTFKAASEAWSPCHVVGRRGNANVQAITLAVFDLDDVPAAQMMSIAERIEGFEYLCVSSHSHRPPGAYRVRLIMPLTREVLPSEWPTVLRTAIFALQLPADPNCKDLSRLYFLPTAPAGTTPLAERGRGRLLDVDALLQMARELPPPQKPTVALEPFDESFEALPDLTSGDLGELRKRLAQVKYRKARSKDPADRERYMILSQILAGKSFCVPGEFKGETNLLRGRDNAINKAASLLAFALPPRTPNGVAVELLRMSLATMDVAPEGFEYWVGRAVFSYDRASIRRLAADANVEAANERLRNRLASMARFNRSGAPVNAPSGATVGTQPHFSPPVPTAVPTEALVADVGETDPDEPAPQAEGEWTNALIFKGDELKPCGENVFLILENDPATKGSFVWNDVEKTMKVTGGLFAKTPLEVIDVEICDWLQRKYKLDLKLDVVGKRIERVVRSHSVDPLADWLRSLPAKWDGRKRIDNAFVDYCHAATVSSAGHDIADHIRRVSRRFFIASVARALDPGCQVDTVWIFEGPEGFYKTSFFRVLAGAYFCGDQITVGDKDSLMLAASNWIIEMPELASWRKADSYSMNAFLTKLEDKFRFPYGRLISTALRRCIFVGTVNPDEGGYFQNIGGVRRRYLPVNITSRIDIERVKADREQLFAEAVMAYMSGERWHFEPHEQIIANAEVEGRFTESFVEAKISDWWYGLAPSARPTELSTTLIAERVLLMTPDKLAAPAAKSIQTEIGSALRQFRDASGGFSFEKRRAMRNGRLAWIYIPSQEALTALQRGNLRAVGAQHTATSTFGRGGGK